MGDELKIRGLKKVVEKEEEILYGIDFYVLPEGCIAAVISFTTPRDASRFASISRIFKSASNSDSVWDRFLPSDYRHLLSRSDGSDSLLLSDSLTKKQLFMRLADNHTLLDNASLSFSLEKSTGKKCITIAPRSLCIVWGDTPRYWTWISESESRFPEVAELLNVCWLEIKGKVQTSLLSPNTTYAAYFVFKMTREAFGFYPPVQVAVESSGGKVEKGSVYLESLDRYQLVPRRAGLFNPLRAPLTRIQSSDKEDEARRPKERHDKWFEVKIGEFWVEGDEDGEVKFSVMEVDAGNWKGGLIIEGIEIRPKMMK